MGGRLRVYSGRNRPDLTPIYRLFEGLTDTKVEVEMIYHLDVERRLIDERDDPKAEVLVTNSQVAVEAVRDTDIFEPYRAEVARGYDEWLRAAPEAAARVHFTGRLEHEDLPLLLPACEAQVMPSTFPESFGMVAAEAAACGALPLSAGHSGMAEVTATLRPALPEHLRPLMSFDVGPGAVREIGSKLVTWLELDPGERDEARAALASEAARRYSWESVAEGVIAAASGQSSG